MYLRTYVTVVETLMSSPLPPLFPQSVVGLQEGDPIYWEPGRLRLRLHHIFSKQALAVSQVVHVLVEYTSAHKTLN